MTSCCGPGNNMDVKSFGEMTQTQKTPPSVSVAPLLCKIPTFPAKAATEANHLVVVYFGAAWCPDCKTVNECVGRLVMSKISDRMKADEDEAKAPLDIPRNYAVHVVYISCDDNAEERTKTSGSVQQSFADVGIPIIGLTPGEYDLHIVADVLLAAEFKTVFQSYPSREAEQFVGIPRTFGIPSIFCITGGVLHKEILTAKMPQPNYDSEHVHA